MNVEAVDDRIEDYNRLTRRKVLFTVACLLIVFVVTGLSISVGARSVPFLRVYEVILDHIQGATYVYGTDEWWDDYVVWEVRLPRALIALTAGAGLSVAGATLQSIMKNPLADAYTTGVSSAAVFGVTVAMIMGFTISTSNQYGLVFNAFVFGLIPVGVMIIVSKMSNVGPATLILSGVAISYLFGALSTLVMTTATNQSLAQAYVWQIGSLQDLSWNSLPLMFGVVSVSTVVLTLTASKLNIMTLGDSSAKGLGLDPDNYRLICLALTSLMVASIISFTGILGFVGLVVPHIVRMIMGSDNKFVLPGSAIFGAAFLLVMDTIAKCISMPDELPVGIVMSFIGAPIFLAMIIRLKKEVW